MIRIQLLRLHPWFDTRLARWLAIGTWMALIFFLSSQSKLPSPDDPLINFLLKKTAHFAVFGVLAILFWRALTPARWVYQLSWALTVLYAISDEYHQSFVTLRTPTPRDVVIDACGAATALLLVWLTIRRRVRE
jgi:VanZ family protein